MELYIVYTTNSIEYVVANSWTEAKEMIHLVYNISPSVHMRSYRISHIGATGINIPLLLEEVEQGYFDVSQPATCRYDSCTWYPFVPFTVRGHYVNIALAALEA